MFDSPVLKSLLDDALMPLSPGSPRMEFRGQLALLSPPSLFGAKAIVRPDLAQACIAGLWLRHNFLDESHRISQDLPGVEGSYWHAIMHRREPDYWNSKYWFRRVGRHPIFAELRERVAAMPEGAAKAKLLAKKDWDADAFVDLCEANEDPNSEGHEFCRRVQQAEWDLLFKHCWCGATG